MATRADKSHDSTIPHGTAGGYCNHRCSCPDCRKAWRDYVREHRATKATVDAWKGTTEERLREAVSHDPVESNERKSHEER